MFQAEVKCVLHRRFALLNADIVRFDFGGENLESGLQNKTRSSTEFSAGINANGFNVEVETVRNEMALAVENHEILLLELDFLRINRFTALRVLLDAEGFDARPGFRNGISIRRVSVSRAADGSMSAILLCSGNRERTRQFQVFTRYRIADLRPETRKDNGRIGYGVFRKQAFHFGVGEKSARCRILDFEIRRGHIHRMFAGILHIEFHDVVCK